MAYRERSTSWKAGADMSKFFAQIFWVSLKFLLRKSKIASMFLTCGISFFILLAVVGRKEPILGVPKESSLAVAGSLLAAALFLIIQWIISLVETAQSGLYEAKYAELVDKHGLKDVYAQRGGQEAVEAYRSLIRAASCRVWAVGMTNRHFIAQHVDSILKLLSEKSDVQVVIAFWDPRAKLLTPTHTIKERCILDVQHLIEQNAISLDTTRVTPIGEREKEFVKRLSEMSEMRGSVEIINVSTVANFTAFLIDNDVFFFPFVSGPDSTNDPTIQCSAVNGIGVRIVEHLENIRKRTDISETVFERVKNDIRINKFRANP